MLRKSQHHWCRDYRGATKRATRATTGPCPLNGLRTGAIMPNNNTSNKSERNNPGGRNAFPVQDRACFMHHARRPAGAGRSRQRQEMAESQARHARRALRARCGLDVVARLMADHLSTRFDAKFLVENRAGASGNIGAAFV